MDYITTTELRTKSKQLVKALKRGEAVQLIYRSKLIGNFRPATESKPFNAKRFKELVEKLNLPYLSYKQREKNYREEMERKHGKGIFRYKRVHRSFDIAE